MIGGKKGSGQINKGLKLKGRKSKINGLLLGGGQISSRQGKSNSFHLIPTLMPRLSFFLFMLKISRLSTFKGLNIKVNMKKIKAMFLVYLQSPKKSVSQDFLILGL